MSRPVVFVDTNCVDNRSNASAFLGNRVEIEKLGKRAKIILPKVVRDELAHHVYSFLKAQLDAIRRNAHRSHLKIEDKHLKNLDLEKMLTDLEKNETIAFQVLDLSNKTAAYEAIYRHSIEGTPPFGEAGDKGFKDALIAKTVDEYVHRKTGELVFLMTKDDKLTEYFDQNDKVIVIKNYADFDNEYSLDKFDDAMVDRVLDFLSTEKGIAVTGKLQKYWLNWDDDLVGQFKDHGAIYYVRIDAQHREPIDFTEYSPKDSLEALENTTDFRSAHENIASLEGVIDFLSEIELLRAYQCFRENDQIYSIANDEDIRQSAQNLSVALEGFALHREASIIRVQYNLQGAPTEDEDGYADEMEAAADAWIEMQGDIMRGK